MKFLALLGCVVMTASCGHPPPSFDRGDARGVFVRAMDLPRETRPSSMTDEDCPRDLGSWIRLGPGALWASADSVRTGCPSETHSATVRVQRDSGNFTMQTDLLRLASVDTIDGQNVLDARLHGDSLVVWRGEDERDDQLYLRSTDGRGTQ